MPLPAVLHTMKAGNKLCVLNWLYREVTCNCALLRTVIQLKIGLTTKMSLYILPPHFHTFQQSDPKFLCRRYALVKRKIKGTGLDRLLGIQAFEVPRFLENRHMKIKRLSALRTGHFYPTGDTPGIHFQLRAESIPWSQCSRTFHVNEKFQWHDLESNTRPHGL